MKNDKTSQICIVTIIGQDTVGIVARLATAMAKANINILDINQNVMEEHFVMTMAVDITHATIDMGRIKKKLDRIGKEMAIGVVNNKTTGVRVIPAPGKKPGDVVHLGGLLGSAPVMEVPTFSSSKFIERRGRVPSPIQALRN